MNSDTAVVVDKLSKKYCKNLRLSLMYGVRDLISEFVLDSNRSVLRADEFWALREVSFSVSRGETFGIIGHNGAGKSTLLLVLNGILRPDLGKVCLRGRVGALIDLGLGFNPLLTGRENIYINAAILSLKRKEVDRQLEGIIEFAELAEFIDAPVGSYSSGMKVRLGFSIASHLNPDVLLIDEVLSVGDASFRERCYHRLIEFKRKGGTIFFISHNAPAVEAVCDRVMLLEKGQVMDIGAAGPIVDAYERSALERGRAVEKQIFRSERADVEIHEVSVYRSARDGTVVFDFEEPFCICIDYEARVAMSQPTFYLSIKRGAQSAPFCSFTLDPEFAISAGVQLSGRHKVVCRIENPRFSPGWYDVEVGIRRNLSGLMGAKHYVAPQIRASFQVSPERFLARYSGRFGSRIMNLSPIVVDHSWSVFAEGEERAKK